MIANVVVVVLLLVVTGEILLVVVSVVSLEVDNELEVFDNGKEDVADDTFDGWDDDDEKVGAIGDELDPVIIVGAVVIGLSLEIPVAPDINDVDTKDGVPPCVVGSSDELVIWSEVALIVDNELSEPVFGDEFEVLASDAAVLERPSSVAVEIDPDELWDANVGFEMSLVVSMLVSEKLTEDWEVWISSVIVEVFSLKDDTVGTDIVV
jgi:hypothetical protein